MLEPVTTVAQTETSAGAGARTYPWPVILDGDAKTLCYVLTVDKIAPAAMAHIHEGAKGTNGPVVVNLAAPTDGNAADCLTEGEAGKFVGDQTVAEILANPERYYVNVHNAEYPGGAVRGQLTAQR